MIRARSDRISFITVVARCGVICPSSQRSGCSVLFLYFSLIDLGIMQLVTRILNARPSHLKELLESRAALTPLLQQGFHCLCFHSSVNNCKVQQISFGVVLVEIYNIIICISFFHYYLNMIKIKDIFPNKKPRLIKLSFYLCSNKRLV